MKTTPPLNATSESLAFDLAEAFALMDKPAAERLLAQGGDPVGGLLARLDPKNGGASFTSRLVGRINAPVARPWDQIRTLNAAHLPASVQAPHLLAQLVLGIPWSSRELHPAWNGADGRALGNRDADSEWSAPDILDLMTQSGWAPGPEHLEEISRQAISHCDLGALEWLGRCGFVFGPHNEPGRMEQSICSAFLSDTPEGKAASLAALGRLADMGAFKDAEGSVGLTDFMAAPLFKHAALLASKGFKPRRQVIGRRFTRAGMTPACSYVTLIGEFNDRDPAAHAARMGLISQTLSWLAANGADFAPSGDLNDPLAADWELADPLYVAASHLARPRDPEEERRAVGVFSVLKSNGADPNHSGLFLNSIIRQMFWTPSRDSGSALLEAALALGAEPSLHPGPALAALTAAAGSGMDSELPQAWFDKLAALGADPKRCPARSLPEHHPIAAAIEARYGAFALFAHQRGVPAGWIHSENGETLLHAAAAQGTKDAEKILARLLADPAALALIDKGSEPTAEKKGHGQTALMRACGELNTNQAEALLKAGACPLAQDSEGQSALHWAGKKYGAKAQKKCEALARLLLNHGADPSLLDAKGLSAGQAMAKRAPLDALATLLEIRPDDVAGDSPAAKATQQALAKRGSQALSIAEKAALGAGPASPAAPKKRSRL